MEDQIKQFATRFGWSEENVRLAVRAGFRCTYCGRHILESVNSYFLWTRDHVVPWKVSKDDSENNLVLACRICNVNLKGQWNPQTDAQDPDSHQQALAAAQAYVQRRREEQEERVAAEREAAAQLLAGCNAASRSDA